MCIGGNSEVSSDAVTHSLSDDVLFVLYRSLNATNAADFNDGSDGVL